MDKKAFKTYLLLITFTIGLVLIVVYFDDILHGIGFFLRLLTPLFIAIVIAFVLNRPYEWFRNLLDGLFETVSQVFGDYVAGQCKEAVILGSLCFLGMTVLRLDYAGLVSVIISVTALIPILGAFLGGAIGVLLLLFVSPGKALLFLLFLVILQQVEGNVIYPKVVGRKIGLPGIWVLLGISVGGNLFGIWGMLLAVPITTILYQFLRRDVMKKEGTMRKETSLSKK